MSDRARDEERDEGVPVLFVLLAVVLGWWLAVRTLAMRLADQTGVATARVEAPAKARSRLGDRPDDYLTVKDLEGCLPLCGKSIRKEIASGRLPSIRMRGKVTVKGSDALAWISARREGGSDAENA